MKKIVVGLIALIIFANITFATELSDIDGHWAEESIMRLIDSNCINGYEDNTFKPDNDVTVAEFIKMLVQYTEYKKVLVGEMWPDWYINTAKYYKFIEEDEFDNYDREITRNEAATILGRFIGLDSVKASTDSFSDCNNETILKLRSMGVVNGYENNSFRGENNISRAEATIIICRAMTARRIVVAQKKYDLKSSEKLTNIFKDASYDSNFKNRYEIKNNKIYFYDDGRYGKINEVSINEKVIDNKKIINLIKCLVQEDAYVAVNYIPDSLTYDQIAIEYGKSEGYVYNHFLTFSFTFYPNKQFELRKISMNDDLSDECFLKITLSKMWKDFYDVKNGEYSHKLNEQKLLKALNTIFDEKSSKEIIDYIMEWYEKTFDNTEGKHFSEMKKIGKYEVNIYITGNSDVNVYIKKRF